MDQWATTREPPPPGHVPKRAEGTLVSPEKAPKHFPKIPGVNLPLPRLASKCIGARDLARDQDRAAQRCRLAN